MSSIGIYEIIGYLASLLVALSLMMSSILKLRVINLAGAVAFTVYGLLIRAYPVAAVNFFISIVDLYYLYEIRSTKEYFTLLEVKHTSEYLNCFLSFYEREIKRFIPNFSYVPSERQFAFFVLRNLLPAGLFIGEMESPSLLCVKLDFVIPGYRDFKIGKFVFFDKSEIFKKRGIRKIVSESGVEKHADYLRRMGFVPDVSDPQMTMYCLNLE